MDDGHFPQDRAFSLFTEAGMGGRAESGRAKGLPLQSPSASQAQAASCPRSSQAGTHGPSSPGVSSWSGPPHPSPPSRSDRCAVTQRRLIFRHRQLLEMAETPEPAPG